MSPKKTLRHSISWNQIDAVGAVYGDTRVKIGKFSFKVRLLTGGQYPGGGEWNDLMYGGCIRTGHLIGTTLMMQIYR